MKLIFYRLYLNSNLNEHIKRKHFTHMCTYTNLHFHAIAPHHHQTNTRTFCKDAITTLAMSFACLWCVRGGLRQTTKANCCFSVNVIEVPLSNIVAGNTKYFTAFQPRTHLYKRKHTFNIFCVLKVLFDHVCKRV